MPSPMIRSLAWSLVLALVSLTGPGARGAVNVVCTNPDLADIARAVGGDKVRVESLGRGSQNPHFVDPKPSFMVKLHDARLFMLNGLDLEVGWVPPLLDGARNPQINPGGPGYIDASAGITVLEAPVGEVTRAEGDIHPFGNPHYLLDPLNGKVVASTIASALKRVEPASGAAFDANLKTFERTIDEALFGRELVELAGGAKLDRLARSGELESFLASTQAGGRPAAAALSGWMGALRPLHGKPIVTYHKNFSYFAQRFGIVVAGYVEPKPGIPPSAKHLVDVVALVKSQGIRLIATQPYFDERAPSMVASKTGARVVTLPSSTDQVAGVDSYTGLFDTIAKRLVESLR